MKKKVIVFLLLTLLFIPRVFASNMYAINLYDKANIFDISDDELDELEFAMLIINNTGIANITNDNSNAYFSNKDSKLLFSVNAETGNITFGENLTKEDNINYTFTEEEKELLNQEGSDLANYSGFSLVLVAPLCDSVCVKSISFVEKSDTASENSSPSFEGLKGYFDVAFLKQNDYIKYKLIINNPTDTDYEIDDKADVGKYMSYEYSYDTDKKIVEKNSDTVVYVTIRYTKEIPAEEFDENGTFVEQEDLVINLGNDAGNEEENPKTMDLSLIVSILFAMIMMGSVFLYVFANRKASIGTLAIAILLIPISLYALEKIQISINAKITVNSKAFDLKYLYENYTKINEIDNYTLAPDFYGENKSCDDTIYKVNNEYYKKCAVLSEPEAHYNGENIDFKPLEVNYRMSDCYGKYDNDINDYVMQCYHLHSSNTNSFSYSQEYNPDYNYPRSFSCNTYDEIMCRFKMPNHNIIIFTEYEYSL